MQLGARQAVAEFLDGEVERRRAHGLPALRPPRAGRARRASAPRRWRRRPRAWPATCARRRPPLGLLGPAPLHRLRGRTRRCPLLVRAPRATAAAGPCGRPSTRRAADLRRAGVRAAVDVDPQET